MSADADLVRRELTSRCIAIVSGLPAASELRTLPTRSLTDTQMNRADPALIE